MNEKLENEKKFIVIGDGDSSVGIPASMCEVTFKGDMYWDEHYIKMVKEFLTEFDDNNSKVFTEEEYDKIIELEEEEIREVYLDELYKRIKKLTYKEFKKEMKEIIGER